MILVDLQLLSQLSVQLLLRLMPSLRYQNQHLFRRNLFVYNTYTSLGTLELLNFIVNVEGHDSSFWPSGALLMLFFIPGVMIFQFSHLRL